MKERAYARKIRLGLSVPCNISRKTKTYNKYSGSDLNGTWCISPKALYDTNLVSLSGKATEVVLIMGTQSQLSFRPFLNIPLVLWLFHENRPEVQHPVNTQRPTEL